MGYRYLETLADTAHKGQHVDKGTVLVFDEESDKDMSALGNYLAGRRGKEVDEKAFDAWKSAAARRAKDAEKAVQQ
jgi:hypothetical protein